MAKASKAGLDVKVRLMWRDERAMGPGKADLLERIVQLGSISAAAKAMNMSYSRAWALVDAMNRSFKHPIVEAATGGKRGGGAQVTETGLHILAHYRAMQRAVAAEADAYLQEFKSYLK